MGHFRVAVCLGFQVSLGVERETSLICIRIQNSFPFEWLCTRTSFETKACRNSEMGYYPTSFPGSLFSASIVEDPGNKVGILPTNKNAIHPSGVAILNKDQRLAVLCLLGFIFSSWTISLHFLHWWIINSISTELA